MYKRLGVDISSHNGNVDFKKLKENGIDFVILRIGYGTNKDKTFDSNYTNAIKHGLHVGAYLYSYACNVKQAKEEGDFVLDCIKNKKFDYPIFLDMEDVDGYKAKRKVTVKTIQDITKKFCETVEKQNKYVGVYASESWFNHQLKPFNNDRYDRWLANWGKNNGKICLDKSKTHKLHQFTDRYVAYDSKKFDGNVSYYDYPSIIKKKHKNGY